MDGLFVGLDFLPEVVASSAPVAFCRCRPFGFAATTTMGQTSTIHQKRTREGITLFALLLKY